MRRAVIGLIIFCAALLIAPGTSHAGVQTLYYSPCGTASVLTTAPGANSDITTTFGVGLDPATCAPFVSPQDRAGEWFPQNEIDFTPPQWHVASDADIPDGEKVGTYNSKVVLGILNNGCNLILNLNFDLLDATIDRSNPVHPTP